MEVHALRQRERDEHARVRAQHVAATNEVEMRSLGLSRMYAFRLLRRVLAGFLPVFG